MEAKNKVIKISQDVLALIVVGVISVAFFACLITALVTKRIVAPEDEVICIDGCDIPRYDADGNEVFAVVSPVGYCNVEMIEQAPRLDTLSGKRIALVGGSFMASTTHFELKRCIEEEYDNVEFFMFNEVGTAGNFAVPAQSVGTKNDAAKTQVERFQAKLEELKIDAVIGGNGGCGICTMKETGSAIAAEYIGIPAVMVAAPTFVSEVHSIGVSRGVPVIRAAEYPGAFASHTETELRNNTRYVVWPQVKKMLTTQITDAEIALYANDGERPYDEIIYYGNNTEVQDYFKYNEWTDGLPIGLPTPAKVKEYLQFTPYAANKVVAGENGTFLQANRKNYVYTIAANAVMSGVPAEFMPLCVAFVECMTYGDWYTTLISSHGWSPYAWLNGPVARQLGIDCGQGAISEENNKALGRFIDLAMINIGGYYVKENRAGTYGYLTPFTFAEDEESCLAAGWQPYPSDKKIYNGSFGELKAQTAGTATYNLNKNYITAGSALSWGNNVATSTTDAEKIMQTMAFDITEKQENGLGTIDWHVYRTMLITRDVAKALSGTYQTKRDLETALVETARRPVIERAYAIYYANTGSQQDKKYTSLDECYQAILKDLQSDPRADVRLTDTPEWLKGEGMPDKMWTYKTMVLYKDESKPKEKWEYANETAFVVTGDASRNKFQVMPGGGYVTVEIKLPDNWDQMLAPLGYEPLAKFYLTEDNGEKQDIVTPANLPDATYVLAMKTDGNTGTRQNYIYFAGYNSIQIKPAGTEKFTEIAIDGYGEHKKLATLLQSLSSSAAVIVKNGKVDEVIIRPTGAAGKLSALKYTDFGTAKITYGVTSSSNSNTVVISATIGQISLDILGEVPTMNSDGNDFIAYSNGVLTINTKAASDSSCTFTATVDGVTHTVIFTMKLYDQIEIKYLKGENK